MFRKSVFPFLFSHDVVFGLNRFSFLVLIIEQPSSTKELDFEFSSEDLEIIKVIGKGSGGVVQLVRHKWLGRLFALKVSTQAKDCHLFSW